MEDIEHEDEHRRPLGIVLLGGLYLFFFMLTMSTFGNPFPFLGSVHQGRTAETLVFLDSMICLYIFLGLMKRQKLTWYLMIGYNTFEAVNTFVNLRFITASELEKVVGQPVNTHSLTINNISVMVALILLTTFVYRHRAYFTNRSKYLF